MHNRFSIMLCWLVSVAPAYCAPLNQQHLLLECIVFSHLEPNESTSSSPDALLDAVSDALAITSDQHAASMPETTPASDDQGETHAYHATEHARSRSMDEDDQAHVMVTTEPASGAPTDQNATEESSHPLVQKLQAAGYHPLYMRQVLAANLQASETIYLSHAPSAEQSLHVQGKFHLRVQKNSRLQGRWLIQNPDTGAQVLSIDHFLPLHTWRYIDHPHYGLLVRISPAVH